MLKILINQGSGFVDYTRYLVQGTLSAEELLNQPSTVDFTLTNFDTQFVIPRRSSYVRIYSAKFNKSFASGFITQEPEREYLGPTSNKHQLNYRVKVSSDDWLLNQKSVPFIPAFVNQTMGQILTRLATALLPSFFTYDCDDGDIVPFYQYDPKKQWSQIAKDFGDSIRFRYKVIDRVIYFKPYGDKSLGIAYDDTETRDRTKWFDPHALETNLLDTPVVNDAIVVGAVEPQNICEDNFIGDGITSDYPLKTKLFRGSSALLLQEDWSSTTFSKELWSVTDPNGQFALTGILNLITGSGAATLGSSYILGNNGLEMGGHLNLDHGEVEFQNAASRGILGGVYANTNLTLANCNLGFLVSGGNISPIVNGVKQASLSSIAVTGVHYVLQTVINTSKWSRYNRIFRTLTGSSYGGTNVTASGDVTFFIQEVSTTQTAPVVLRKTAVLPVTLPSFALYAPVNSVDLQATLTSTQITQPPQGKLLVKSLAGPTGLQLPTLPQNLTAEQKYVLGFGIDNQTATLQETADVQQLRFYSDSIPGAGARIKLRTWEAGKAIGRVRDPASVLAEGVVTGDNGVRSSIVTDLNPLPRTSEECELAASAFIADRTVTQFNGSYTYKSQYVNLLVDDYPRPGRYFNVNSTLRNCSGKQFVVRRTQMSVENNNIEQVNFQIQFGPDLYTDRLLPKFLKPRDQILTPQDAAVDPSPQTLANVGLTFVPDFPSATCTGVSGTQISVDLGSVPVSGAEVRRVDSNWGINDKNRLLLTTAQTFLLPRAAYDQTYYIRQINGPQTSRFTTQLRVVYPLVPSAPTGSIDTRDRLKPVVALGLTGDIRNIFGVEVRSCMVNVTGAVVTGGFAANLEQPIECLDNGLIGTDASVGATIATKFQNFTTSKKLFTRSEFLLDYTLYAPGTQFYFEGVVTNAAYRDALPREIYIEKQMRGRTANPNPTIVHTLSVPPGAHRQRIRFSTPFTGYQYDTFAPSIEGPTVTGAQDYTDAYRVYMQAEAPPVLAYDPNTTKFPGAPFELHSLKLIGVSVGAQRTAIEIPLSAVEGESNTDVGASAFSTTSTSFVDVTPATIWIYNAAEWSTLSKVRFNATLSCPQSSSGGLVSCTLYDVTSGANIATVDFPIATYPSQAATVQTSFNVTGNLIDGHQYTVRMKVTAPATTGHFYKARLVMVLNPLLKSNVYWRYASGVGSQPIRVSDGGSFALSPGSFSSRLLYNPSAYSSLTGLFCEATGTGTFSPSNPITDDFNRADGLVNVGVPDWAGMGFAAVLSIVSNEVFTNDNSRGCLRTSSDTSVSHQFVSILYVRNFLFNAFGSASMNLWLCTTGFPVGGAGFNAYALMFGRQFGSLNGGVLIQRWVGGVGTTIATLDGIFNFSGTQGFSIKFTADVGVSDTTLNVLVNDVVVLTFVDSTVNRRTTGKAGMSTAQVDGAGFYNITTDNFACGTQVANPVTMVNAELADGPYTQLPGWFAYTSGDHIPAQNYTVTSNMAAFVAAYAALSIPMVDDAALDFVGIIFSAWQFELFAAVLNNAPSAAGVVTVNALRDTIIAGLRTAIALMHTNHQDWVSATSIAFTSQAAKGTVRAVLSSSLALTDGNRYFAKPATGLQQALLVYQITAVNGDEVDGITTIPVPEAPSVLIQRRFTAPSDLNWIFDNNPYRIRALCFKAFFFNHMWEYSPELQLTATMAAPPVPKIEVISVLSIDIQVRLDVVAIDDTASVTVEMAPISLFIGTVVRVKGGPLQSVYSLHVPTGPNTPVAGQYIRARRSDYLGNSDWSGIIYVSADDIRNSSFLSSTGGGAITSSPLNNLFSYVSDGTTITWSWAAFTLTYPDGFVQFVAAGSFTQFTGLTNSTVYKFYPYLTGVRQAVSVVTILKSTVGSGTLEDPTSQALTTADGSTPLSRGAMDGSTTSGGASSGSGGGVG